MPLEEKGGSNQIKRVLASECSSCGLVQTPPQTEPAPNRTHFSKISPGEFSKTSAMQRGCHFGGTPYTL